MKKNYFCKHSLQNHWRKLFYVRDNSLSKSIDLFFVKGEGWLEITTSSVKYVRIRIDIAKHHFNFICYPKRFTISNERKVSVPWAEIYERQWLHSTPMAMEHIHWSRDLSRAITIGRQSIGFQDHLREIGLDIHILGGRFGAWSLNEYRFRDSNIRPSVWETNYLLPAPPIRWL